MVTDKFSPWEPSLLGIAAIVAFAVALVLLWKDKTASASVSGALAMLAMLFIHFPEIDKVEALSVGFTLDHKVQEAKNVLGKLETLTAASARSAYVLAAWQGRLGGMPPKQKQAFLDDIQKQMDIVEVPEIEQNEIMRPYLNLIGFDFYHFFISTLLTELDYKPSNAAASSATSEARTKIIELTNNFKISDNEIISPESLKRDMQAAISENAFTTDEIAKLNGFASYINKLFVACLSRKGYTPEAIAFMDEFNAAEAKYFKSDKNALSYFVAKHQN